MMKDDPIGKWVKTSINTSQKMILKWQINL